MKSTPFIPLIVMVVLAAVIWKTTEPGVVPSQNPDVQHGFFGSIGSTLGGVAKTAVTTVIVNPAKTVDTAVIKPGVSTVTGAVTTGYTDVKTAVVNPAISTVTGAVTTGYTDVKTAVVNPAISTVTDVAKTTWTGIKDIAPGVLSFGTNVCQAVPIAGKLCGGSGCGVFCDIPDSWKTYIYIALGLIVLFIVLGLIIKFRMAAGKSAAAQ